MIEFIPLDESHIPLMQQWLSSGEALRWYGRDEPQSETVLRHKYLVDKPAGGTRSFVIHQDEHPIGYIQYYRVADYPDWASLVSAQPGDYGLDLFIGRDDLIGEGIGTEIVHTALRKLVFTNEDAKRCILGPEPDNRRAIRCYEKCGFKHLRTVTTDTDEEEYVMAIKRPNKNPHKIPSFVGNMWD